MFRAHRAHHQERQIVSTQPLVAVTRCVGGLVVCRSEDLHTIRPPTATRGIYQESVTPVIYRLLLKNCRNLKMATKDRNM